MSDTQAPNARPRPSTGPSWSDLGPRVASAAVLIPVAAGSVILGGYFFAAVIGLIFAGAYREWENMVTLKPVTPFGMVLMALVALSAILYPAFGLWATAAVIALAAIAGLAARGEAAVWRAGGLVFFGLVIAAMLLLRGSTTTGIVAGFYIGVVIWTTDTAAFFTGRQVGGEKLAPDISPGKTRSGAIGGLVVSTILGTAMWVIFTPSPWWLGVIFSAFLSIVGQAGDLFESALKRRFRVKDSGDIIPGHGGLMDRLDSVTFGALAAALIGILHTGGIADVAAGLLHW